MTVVFELFGPARLRAGHAEITVSACTLGEALRQLATTCPPLAGPVIQDGRLSRHYRLSLNGRSFVSDPDLELDRSDRLILLSAEAGG
ncbi:MAG: hypothetical protein E2P03_00895 [Acidobacteria bacterium]|nr:MAG: hypothetical protein E2P03_00895 [Acidobacteriota bacterium]